MLSWLLSHFQGYQIISSWKPPVIRRYDNWRWVPLFLTFSGAEALFGSSNWFVSWSACVYLGCAKRIGLLFWHYYLYTLITDGWGVLGLCQAWLRHIQVWPDFRNTGPYQTQTRQGVKSMFQGQLAFTCQAQAHPFSQLGPVFYHMFGLSYHLFAQNSHWITGIISLGRASGFL